MKLTQAFHKRGDFFILVLILFSQGVQGQMLGKAGTIWQHCFFPVLELPIPFELLTVTSISSFELNNLECNTLKIHRVEGLRVSDTINICRDGDRVYYQGGDSLFLLYDFSLEQGDTLTIRFPIEFDTSFLYDRPQDDIYHRLLIDSVAIQKIAGEDLIRQFVTALDDYLLISFGSYYH
jgi:hypothetical protein